VTRVAAPEPVSASELYVGLMSGTSLDGIDAVLVDLSETRPRLISAAHHPFESSLRRALLELNASGDGELERAALLANELARCYARATAQVLAEARTGAAGARAIGCHGQTVRHRPECGYTIQLVNAALLAELSGICVVSDFRSRDLAAGGQGAPLVPAFHAAAFATRAESRLVLNLGGIANLTWLPRSERVVGFDTGPGNCLLDLWAARHLGTPLDAGGEWAAGASPVESLLDRMLEDPFFSAPPPKSTGRDLFNERWLADRGAESESPRAVQATLLELTARSVHDAAARFCGRADRVIVCGGGTLNLALMHRLGELFAPAPVEPSALHGVDPSHVEAIAFAWLARRALQGLPGNLPAVTGAAGPRVLGAVYAA
jgi:anhydro-N-acetylmuramic acid kinase